MSNITAHLSSFPDVQDFFCFLFDSEESFWSANCGKLCALKTNIANVMNSCGTFAKTLFVPTPSGS